MSNSEPADSLDRRTPPARHGAYRFQRTGELPDRLAWLRPELEAFCDGLAADKGGPEAITVAEGALIDQAGRLLTTILLLTWNVQTRGAVTRKGEVRPPLNALAAYENALRHTLQALGLGRRQKDALTLTGYLAARRADTPAPLQAASGEASDAADTNSQPPVDRPGPPSPACDAPGSGAGADRVEAP